MKKGKILYVLSGTVFVLILVAITLVFLLSGPNVKNRW